MMGSIELKGTPREHLEKALLSLDISKVQAVAHVRYALLLLTQQEWLADMNGTEDRHAAANTT